MPFGVIGAYACQNLQTDLVRYFGKNAPQFRTLGDVSLIKWLLSPQNRAGFEQISVTSVPGKKRAVAFMVETPYCYNLCSIDRLCTEDPVYYEPQSQEVVFSLTSDPYRHCDENGDPVVLKFDLEDLAKYCMNDDYTWIQNQISRYLLRWEQALDTVIWEKILTQVGTNAAGQAITNIPLFHTSGLTNTVSLNEEGIWYTGQLMKDIGVDSQFAMIGGQIINKISQYKKWATLNAAGVDLSKSDDLIPYLFYDRNADTLMGMKDWLQLAPGTSQIVTWNKYAGSMKKSVTDLYTHGQITLPTTGLTVDYEWTYDYKCKIWTFEAFLYIELAVVPAGGCGTNMATVNGIVRVHDCSASPVVPECPEVIEG